MDELVPICDLRFAGSRGRAVVVHLEYELYQSVLGIAPSCVDHTWRACSFLSVAVRTECLQGKYEDPEDVVVENVTWQWQPGRCDRLQHGMEGAPSLYAFR